MKNKNTMLAMLSYLKGRRPAYITGCLLLGSYPLLDSLFTGYLYRIITSLDSGFQDFYRDMVRMFLFLAGLLAASYVGNYLYNKSTVYADKKVRLSLSRKLIRMELRHWYKRHFSQWLTLLGKDTDNASEAYKSELQSLVSLLLPMIGGTAVIAFVNIWMAIFAVAVGLVYFAVGILKQKTMKLASSDRKKYSADAVSRLNDLVEGSQVTRFYRVGAVLEKEFDAAVEASYENGMKCAKILGLNAALGQLGYLLAYGGSIMFGLVLVTVGNMELSDMLFVWPTCVQVSYSIQKIGFFKTTYQKTGAAVERIMEVFDLPEETGGTVTAVDSSHDPCISLRDVSFAYDNGREVLKHINLEIRKGEKIAFVGESGSGKSTLVKLLMNFFPVSGGECRVYDRDVREYELGALRSQFSYVPQMACLFNDTIEENIRLVKPDASKSELKLACDRAYVTDFVEGFPEKGRTNVGESGSKVSGGQRQRIAIARAFLWNAPIMILDEISAALDNESQEKIDKAVENLSAGQTVLMVTHRLTSARSADRIVVMQDGEIVETGSHEELMDLGKVYYKLYRNAEG